MHELEIDTVGETGRGPLTVAAGAHRPPVDGLAYISDAVFRLERAIAKIGAQRLRPWNMTLSSYAALRILERQPNLSLAQLSRRCFVKPQTMTRIVAELERRGYVQRGPNEDSLRAVSLTLTAEGVKAAHGMAAEVEKIEETLGASLTPPEVAHFHALIRERAALIEAEIKTL